MKIKPYTKEMLPLKQVKKLPYYKDLLHIRKVLEETLANFSKNRCCFTAKIVSLATDLQALGGHYTPEFIKGGTDYRMHGWNYDPERGLYVDITQGQYISTLPKLIVLPSTTKVLTPNEDDTKRVNYLHLGIRRNVKNCGN